MARPRTPVVEITEALNPRAEVVDQYIRPESPAKSPLWETAKALQGLSNELDGFIGKATSQYNEDQAALGEAAFYQNNQVGYEEGVRTGQIPASSSPFFVKAYKRAEGLSAGYDFDLKMGQEYASWEGKTYDDPNAFDNWFKGAASKQINTNDPEKLKGILPSLRQTQQKLHAQFLRDREQDIRYRATQAYGASITKTIDTYVLEGQRSETAKTDLYNLNSAVQQIRNAGYKSGLERDAIDKQVVDAVTSASIKYNDPSLLSVLDMPASEGGPKLSDTPYGRDEKIKADHTVQTRIRQEMERSRQEKDRLDKAESDAALGTLTRELVKNPNYAPPEELLRAVEKKDPDFRVKLITMRKNVLEDTVAEDPEKLMQLHADILRGGGMDRVVAAMQSGDIRKKDSLESAIRMVDLAQKTYQSDMKITDATSFKRIISNIQSKAADPNWKGSINQEPGLTQAGRAAVNDATIAAMRWALEHPQASAIEREKFLQDLGETIYRSIGDDPRTNDKTYTQDPRLREPGAQQPQPQEQQQPQQPQQLPQQIPATTPAQPIGTTPGNPALPQGATTTAAPKGPPTWTRSFIGAPKAPVWQELQKLLQPSETQYIDAMAKRLGVDPQVIINRYFDEIKKHTGESPTTQQPVAPQPQAPSGPRRQTGTLDIPGMGRALFENVSPQAIAQLQDQLGKRFGWFAPKIAAAPEGTMMPQGGAGDIRIELPNGMGAAVVSGVSAENAKLLEANLPRLFPGARVVPAQPEKRSDISTEIPKATPASFNPNTDGIELRGLSPEGEAEIRQALKEFGDTTRMAFAPGKPDTGEPQVSARRIERINRLPIRSVIEEEARAAGFDPEKLKVIVSIESSGNPKANAGSYHGLLQLSQEEFSRYGGSGDIYNERANLRAGIQSLKSKQARFQREFGREPSATELYLLHQQGEGGLRAHESNPNRLAWQSMASTGEGRRKGERWAKLAIWGNVPNDFKPMFGNVNNITSGQFIAVWMAKLEDIPFEEALARVTRGNTTRLASSE